MSDDKPTVEPTEPLMALLRKQETSLATRESPMAALERAALDFKPDERQQAFQEVAASCEERGQGYVRDWIIASRSDERIEGAPSMKEWNTWMKQPGFTAWFYDNFPLPRQISQEDIDGLDVLFWQTLRNLMADGESKALDIYAKVTGKLGPKEEAGSDNTAVVEWLQVNAGAVSWRNGDR